MSGFRLVFFPLKSNTRKHVFETKAEQVRNRVGCFKFIMHLIQKKGHFSFASSKKLCLKEMNILISWRWSGSSSIEIGYHYRFAWANHVFCTPLRSFRPSVSVVNRCPLCLSSGILRRPAGSYQLVWRTIRCVASLNSELDFYRMGTGSDHQPQDIIWAVVCRLFCKVFQRTR
jgi:hypothetical protein